MPDVRRKWRNMKNKNCFAIWERVLTYGAWIVLVRVIVSGAVRIAEIIGHAVESAYEIPSVSEIVASIGALEEERTEGEAAEK